MVPISYLWIQYLGHCKLCKYSPDENIIDMWKKIIIIPILRLWSRVGLTSECLFWWVQIRYWKKCHLKRTSLQDFVMIIIFQISTDAETGKTRVSRINGHVHSIPGKEVRRNLRDHKCLIDKFSVDNLRASLHLSQSLAKKISFSSNSMLVEWLMVYANKVFRKWLTW